VDAKPDPTTVTIVVKPARAVVEVDGRVVTKRPIVIKKEVGEKLVLKGSLRGYDERTETIVVPNEATHRVELTLSRARARAKNSSKRRSRTSRRTKRSAKPKPKAKPKHQPDKIEFDPTRPEIQERNRQRSGTRPRRADR